MSDPLAILVTGYVVLAVVWFLWCFDVWREGLTDGSTPDDRRRYARAVLLAPIWPLAALWFLGPMIGKFATDVTRGKRDE